MPQKLFDSPAMRETIRRLIRSRMAYRGFEYKDLARRLHDLGVEQSETATDFRDDQMEEILEEIRSAQTAEASDSAEASEG